MDRFLVLKEGDCVAEIVPRVRGRDHLRQPSFRGAGEAIIKLFPVKSINFDGSHRFEANEVVGIDAGSGSEPFQEASLNIELGRSGHSAVLRVQAREGAARHSTQ